MNAVAKHPEYFTVEDCVDDRILSVVNTAERGNTDFLYKNVQLTTMSYAGAYSTLQITVAV